MKREDLEVGEIYTCALPPQIEVLIIGKREVDTSGGGTVTVVTGKYYNPVSGLFEEITINDNQLMSNG